ncbi:hypothetical protein [[Mycoplasma] collis]|uniref:hypothetical protein n=1 Tax=[Mycoplasma] collis TaxID=2127 RepID=UPI00051C0FC0|nr:hypothetical protein [[Mycoplasma] collis]
MKKNKKLKKILLLAPIASFASIATFISCSKSKTNDGDTKPPIDEITPPNVGVTPPANSSTPPSENVLDPKLTKVLTLEDKKNYHNIFFNNELLNFFSKLNSKEFNELENLFNISIEENFKSLDKEKLINDKLRKILSIFNINFDDLLKINFFEKNIDSFRDNERYYSLNEITALPNFDDKIKKIMNGATIPSFYTSRTWSELLKNHINANYEFIKYFEEFFNHFKNIWKKYVSQNYENSFALNNWWINYSWDEKDIDWLETKNKEFFSENNKITFLPKFYLSDLIFNLKINNSSISENELQKLSYYEISNKIIVPIERIRSSFIEFDFNSSDFNEDSFFNALDEIKILNPIDDTNESFITFKELSKKIDLNKLDKYNEFYPFWKNNNLFKSWKDFIQNYKKIEMKAKEIFNKYIVRSLVSDELENNVEYLNIKNLKIKSHWKIEDFYFFADYIDIITNKNNPNYFFFNEYYLDVINKKNYVDNFNYSSEINSFFNNKNEIFTKVQNNAILYRNLNNIISNILTENEKITLLYNHNIFKILDFFIGENYTIQENINSKFLIENTTLNTPPLSLNELFLEKNKNILEQIKNININISFSSKLNYLNFDEILKIYNDEENEILEILNKYVVNDDFNSNPISIGIVDFKAFRIKKIWDKSDFIKIEKFFEKWFFDNFQYNDFKRTPVHSLDKLISLVNKNIKEYKSQKAKEQNILLEHTKNDFSELKILSNINSVNVKDKQSLKKEIENFFKIEILNIDNNKKLVEKISLDKLISNQSILNETTNLLNNSLSPNYHKTNNWKDFLIKENEMIKKVILILEKNIKINNSDPSDQMNKYIEFYDNFWINSKWDVNEYEFLINLNKSVFDYENFNDYEKNDIYLLNSYQEKLSFLIRHKNVKRNWILELNSEIEKKLSQNNDISFVYDEQAIKKLNIFSIFNSSIYNKDMFSHAEIIEKITNILTFTNPIKLEKSEKISLKNILNDEQIKNIFIQNISDDILDREKIDLNWETFFNEYATFFNNLERIIKTYIVDKNDKTLSDDKYVLTKNNFKIKKMWKINDFNIMNIYIERLIDNLNYQLNKYIEKQISNSPSLVREFSENDVLNALNPILENLNSYVENKTETFDDEDIFEKFLSHFKVFDSTIDLEKNKIKLNEILNNPDKKAALLTLLDRNKDYNYIFELLEFEEPSEKWTWETILTHYLKEYEAIKSILKKYIKLANNIQNENDEFFQFAQKIWVKKSWIVSDYLKLKDSYYWVLPLNEYNRIINFDYENENETTHVPLIKLNKILYRKIKEKRNQ